jgi:hypothetical protein
MIDIAAERARLRQAVERIEREQAGVYWSDRERFDELWSECKDALDELERLAWLERAEREREIAKGWLGQLVGVIGSPGEIYLRSRGLEPPYPDCVRFLEPTDRTGEGAVVAVLTDGDGEPVALQLGYVDARGARSTIEPPRKLWPLVEGWPERGLIRIQAPAGDESFQEASSSDQGETDPVEALRRAAAEAARKPFL